MVPTLSQKLRGHLEGTTQVQCPLATVLDTNGTLSFQFPMLREGDHISSLTQPGAESHQAQLLIQQGSLLSGITTVPAALRATKQNSKEEKRLVQNSMQRGTGLLQKPEGCEKKPSVGLLEETHGRRKKRQSTSMSCGSYLTLTQRPSAGTLSLAQEGTELKDLMESSSTTKVSLLPVTGTRVPDCRETSNPLRASIRPAGRLVSKSLVGYSALGQSLGEGLCNTGSSNSAAQPLDKIGTWEQSTSRFRHKEPRGNWAKAVSSTNYDRAMLKAERWPSIDESTTFSSCRKQAGFASHSGRHFERYKVSIGNQQSEVDMGRAHPTGRRKHLSPSRHLRWLNNQDVGMTHNRSELNCTDATLNRPETNCLSRAHATFHARPQMNLKCIGKSMTLKQAPKRQSRKFPPTLEVKRHSDRGDLLTKCGKRKWEKAAGKIEVASDVITENQLPTVFLHKHDTGFGNGSCSQDTSGHRIHGFDHGATEPVLLMVNKDFAVTSPVRENLLFTLALSQRRAKSGVVCDSKQDEEGHTGDATGIQKWGQILVGQFTAFSSLMGFGLGHDARRVATEPNAGGSSTISETLSVEYFVRRFQARDVVTEMEVEYSFMNMKKVDYICTISGQRVGVSVTRAMSYPDPKNFNEDTATALLRKKLFGLVVARSGVTSQHSFSQCILHVWCETRNTAKILEEKYPEISTEMQVADDVIMLLTVAEGSQARPIFYEACLHSKLSSTKEFLWCF